MPHQCTTCDRLFENGSKVMLDGCPDCGGNQFQFFPSHESVPKEAATRDDTDRGDGEFIVATERPVGPEPSAGTAGPEDVAQAQARADVIPSEELPPRPQSDEEPVAEPTDDEFPAPEPTVEQLRSELEETFESIRIVKQGEYELNLMGLYERDACIIELGEDGRYVIDVPEMFNASE